MGLDDGGRQKLAHKYRGQLTDLTDSEWSKIPNFMSPAKENVEKKVEQATFNGNSETFIDGGKWLSENSVRTLGTLKTQAARNEFHKRMIDWLREEGFKVDQGGTNVIISW